MADIQGMAEKLQVSTAHVVVVFAAEGQLLDLFSEVEIIRNIRKLRPIYPSTVFDFRVNFRM